MYLKITDLNVYPAVFYLFFYHPRFDDVIIIAPVFKKKKQLSKIIFLTEREGVLCLLLLKERPLCRVSFTSF